MPFSHHSHSGQFCCHAENTLEEMVQAAISRGFQVYSLTEHMPRGKEDFYPEEQEKFYSEEGLVQLVDDFYREAVRLREKYASQIQILIGFESEWIRPSSLKLIQTLLGKHTFDFFVGSVHHVHTISIDFDRPKYEDARLRAGGTDERLFEDYFDSQYSMLQAIQPPVVGHFDLIRLLSDEKDEGFKRWDGVWKRIQRNLEYVVSYGGVLELNSSALRKGMSEPYPCLEICEAFLRIGGCFTMSDDSHSVGQVGTNYRRLLEFIRRAEIPEIYFVERGPRGRDRRFSNSRFSRVTSSELEGHSFWGLNP